MILHQPLIKKGADGKIEVTYLCKPHYPHYKKQATEITLDKIAKREKEVTCKNCLKQLKTFHCQNCGKKLGIKENRKTSALKYCKPCAKEKRAEAVRKAVQKWRKKAEQGRRFKVDSNKKRVS